MLCYCGVSIIHRTLTRTAWFLTRNVWSFCVRKHLQDTKDFIYKVSPEFDSGEISGRAHGLALYGHPSTWWPRSIANTLAVEALEIVPVMFSGVQIRAHGSPRQHPGFVRQQEVYCWWIKPNGVLRLQWPSEYSIVLNDQAIHFYHRNCYSD